MRAAIRECWFQNEGFPGIGREGLPDRVNLLLHFGHWPGTHAFFDEPHMASKVFPGLCIDVRIRTRYGNLITQRAVSNVDILYESNAKWRNIPDEEPGIEALHI